jgi:hypothetical protein
LTGILGREAARSLQGGVFVGVRIGVLAACGLAAEMGDLIMSRVIAIVACGLTLAACSMSMPSLDFMKSAPTTETLRVESEPAGADARTTAGQSCRTPCELTVPTGGEMAVTVAMNGYEPQTVPVRADGSGALLQPNPVYVELQPSASAPTKRRPAKKKTTTAARAVPATAGAPAAAAARTEGAGTTAPAANSYPWPPPPQ